MYLQQPSMIFYPYKKLDANPGDWGLDYSNIILRTSDDIQLHGWFIPATGSIKTILFFHGNAGNISHRQDSIRIFHNLGLNVFIIDYRGYGSSDGKPGEKGLYLDARAAWNYLINQEKIKPENIFIFGRSLGGAVATQLATEVNSAGLILESTFTSARAMAGMIMPVLSRLIYLRYPFNSVGRIKKINQPLLVIHSPQDDIIPYQLGVSLFETAKEPKIFMKISGNHNTGFIMSQPAYGLAIKDFIEK